MPSLTGAIQESLLALLLYDQEHASRIRTLVPASTFDQFYRHLADAAVKYIDQFGQAPDDHTLDLIDDLKTRFPKDGQVYDRIYESVTNSADGVNADYVISKVQAFLRYQRLKSGLVEVIDVLQDDDAGNSLDQAEQLLGKLLVGSADVFDSGVDFTDLSKSLRFLDEEEVSFSTGISALDERNLGPARKELHLFIALPKRGKTWWFVNLAKQAILNHQRVVHVSLEMSEAKMCQRYYQSFFSVSKRPEQMRRMEFAEDELGRFVGMEEQEITGRPAFSDDQIRKELGRRMKVFGGRINLYVKQFPTNALSVRELEGYLDSLEMVNHFIPDLLLVDYADLMTTDPKNLRHSLSAIYKDLRGLAVKRNIAIATASQSNRSGADQKLLTDANVAEDYSKIATVDTALTYNQTETEKELGLARLYVADGRNDEDRFTVLISQNYALGQFCFDSTRMVSQYWDRLREEEHEEAQTA